MVLGLLITRAGSEHLGWARSQGGNFGLPGGVLQIEALQEVLKKLKSKRIPIYEKKYGQVPMVRLGVTPSPHFPKRKYTTLNLVYAFSLPEWLNNLGDWFADSLGSPLFPWSLLARGL